MTLKMHENESMSPRERVETVLRIKEPDRVPIVASFHCTPALLSGITIEDFFYDVEKSYKAARNVWEMFGGFDLFSALSPILIYYLPVPNSHSLYYFDWTLPKGNIPEQMHEKEIMKREDYDIIIEKGDFNHFKRKSRDLNKEFSRIISQYSKIDLNLWLESMDVIPSLAQGFVEAPFDIISFLRGLNNFLVDIIKIPEKIIEACDATVDSLLKLLDNQLKFTGGIGPKMVLFGFSRLANNFISPKKFELFWPNIKKITNYIIQKGWMVQFHIDNDYTEVLDFFTEFPKGKTMFHLDQTDIFKAKEVLGDKACVMGNIPPSITALGSPQDVENYCREQIEGCKDGGGYMLCSACVLPDDTPAVNIKAMKDSVMKYGFYRA